MKKLLPLLICTLIAGCTGVYHPIHPVTYNVPTNVHIDRPASLVAKSGAMTTQKGQAYNGGGGLVGLMIAEHEAERSAPVYFGQQDQLLFMQSLRQYLDENDVFTDLQIGTQVADDDKPVYIIVTFMSTRIGEATENYPVTLDAVLTIKDGHAIKPFTRHFFIHEDSKKTDNFDGNYFTYHTTKAAERLLKDVAKGVIVWAKQYH